MNESKIGELGCIKSLQLPDGWVKGDSPPEFGGRILVRYYPLGSPKVRVCSYLRQVALSIPAAEAFQTSLYSDFHELTKDELAALAPVLEGMSNAETFQISEASTGYVTNKRVLRIRGRWLKSDEETMSCFMDVRGDGKIVQQLYYIAPADAFETYKSEVERLFLSIQWHVADDK